MKYTPLLFVIFLLSCSNNPSSTPPQQQQSTDIVFKGSASLNWDSGSSNTAPFVVVEFKRDSSDSTKYNGCITYRNTNSLYIDDSLRNITVTNTGDKSNSFSGWCYEYSIYQSFAFSSAKITLNEVDGRIVGSHKVGTMTRSINVVRVP